MLACPYTYNAIFAAFSQEAILDSHPHHGREIIDTGTAVPMPAIDLVIDLSDIFTCCSDDTAGVEHHACNRVIVGISIMNRASAEIPYLKIHQPTRVTNMTVQLSAYPDTSIQTPGDQVHIIELQASYWPSMAY